MKSSVWRQVNWLSVLLHSFYVIAMGIALAFFARLFGLADSQDFAPALTVAVALAVVFASYHLVTRESRQPFLHGLLIGLIVGLLWFTLSALTVGLTVPAIAGLLMQVLGGLLGARMGLRVLQGGKS